MRELLIVNPNTSASVTALLLAHGQAAAGPDARVRAVTARLGSAYIVDEASYAVAGHAALDAWAAALADGPAPEAVLIGCFGDPGLFALREASPVPVTGLAEAAFTVAARRGRFAVVTGGERWPAMLRRLAQALGFGDALAGIRAVAPSGAELAADRDRAIGLLAEACRDIAATTGAEVVVLGGAGLAGLGPAVGERAGVAVIDSVQAGVEQALTLPRPPTARAQAGFDVAWSGVSPELAAVGKRSG